MSPINPRRWLIAGGTALLLATTASLTPLQAGPGGTGGRPPKGPAKPAITLTAAQQQALKDAHAAIATQSETLRTQLAAARKAVQEAVLAEPPVEATILAAAKAEGEIEGALAVIRAKELAKIRPLFTAELWAQLKTAGLFGRELIGHEHPAPGAPDDDGE